MILSTAANVTNGRKKQKTKTTKKVTYFRQAADVEWLSKLYKPLSNACFLGCKSETLMNYFKNVFLI